MTNTVTIDIDERGGPLAFEAGAGYSRQVKAYDAAEVRLVVVSFDAVLEADETLTGTPTATDATTDLTLASKAVSSDAFVLYGRTIPAARCVQFTTTGGTAGTTYDIVVACGTTGGTATQTVQTTIRVQVL